MLFKPNKLDPRLTNIQYPGIESKGVFQIFPIKESFKIKIIGVQKPKTVSREMLPMIGSYAITCYKAQGQTYKKCIIDFESAIKGASSYVMASRVQSIFIFTKRL